MLAHFHKSPRATKNIFRAATCFVHDGTLVFKLAHFSRRSKRVVFCIERSRRGGGNFSSKRPRSITVTIARATRNIFNTPVFQDEENAASSGAVRSRRGGSSFSSKRAPRKKKSVIFSSCGRVSQKVVEQEQDNLAWNNDKRK